MRTDDHRMRMLAAALTLTTGALAVLGTTTGHALVGWLSALVAALAACGITISRARRD